MPDDPKVGTTTQSAAEAKDREGKTGTSNKEAAKQLDALDKDSGPKASPTPKPKDP